jgi:DNA-binding NarL/FixJ family response regulator
MLPHMLFNPIQAGNHDMKVFVVEDSAPVRERLVEMIREVEDADVVGEAGTCDAAVAGILATRPDVAIFDVHLPDGSGIRVLAAIKRQLANLRGIVLTNYDTPQHRTAAAEAGAEYFLDKSADFERIPEILERMALGGSRGS